jgi:phosphatidylglycerol:prolipoprotein diacylglycerol transferase
MALLLLLLLGFSPLRRREGQVMALFMICYAIHRFLNEILRNDTEIFADGMTLSQNLSVVIFGAGLVLFVWMWRQPGCPQVEAKPENQPDAASQPVGATVATP